MTAGRVRRRGPARRPVRAFTLFEIVIVLSLLVLLFSMALPLMDSQIRASYFPESADRLATTLYMLRGDAVAENRRHRMRFESDAQQPILEYEPDPIREPGKWTWVEKPWASQQILLGDTWVAEVRTGRPAYTLPISETEQPPQDVRQLADAFLVERVQGAGINNEALLEMQYEQDIQLTEEAEQIDIPDLRPPIVFEADGSVEWATLVLAQGAPAEGQTLDSDARQVWVLLDGRTGIARVKEPVDDDELTDPEFFVMREKIELPITGDPDAQDLGGELGMAMIGEGLRNGDTSLFQRALNANGLSNGLAGGMPQDLEAGDESAESGNNSNDDTSGAGPVSRREQVSEAREQSRRNAGKDPDSRKGGDEQPKDGLGDELADELTDDEEEDKDAKESDDEIPPDLAAILDDPNISEEQKAEFLRLFIESAVSQD